MMEPAAGEQRRDHYRVLGVSRGETAAGIRDSYHALERRFHGDRLGQQGTRAWRQIDEAYQVLSDLAARWQHDRELRRWEAQAFFAGEPEPFGAPPLSLLDDPVSLHPSFESLRERFLRNFTGVGVPKAERPEPLHLRVALTPEEAARGIVIRLGIPVFERCAACAGSGHDLLSPCGWCGGDGVIAGERSLALRLPAQLPAGSALELPLDGLGVHNLYLSVRLLLTDPPRG